jgi:outer membrane lipoprotein-sorting protein
MMKKLIYTAVLVSLLASCTESLEDKAAREAKEYTEKYCPTPYVNDSRTDSATFDKSTKTYVYYISLRNKADNKQVIEANKNKLHKIQKEALDNNPGLKKYKEEHFTFRFVYHSAKNPKEILLDDVFKY